MIKVTNMPNKGRQAMENMIWMVGFVLLYFALQLYILPKLGIPTWMSRSCSVEQPKTKKAEPKQDEFVQQESIKSNSGNGNQGTKVD